MLLVKKSMLIMKDKTAQKWVSYFKIVALKYR